MLVKNIWTLIKNTSRHFKHIHIQHILDFWVSCVSVCVCGPVQNKYWQQIKLRPNMQSVFNIGNCRLSIDLKAELRKLYIFGFPNKNMSKEIWLSYFKLGLLWSLETFKSTLITRKTNFLFTKPVIYTFLPLRPG